MGRLPGMAYSSGITRSQQVQFGGLRHHPNAGDGEIYDMENMSARDYPLLRSRDKRRNGRTLTGATEMFFDNHAMWYVDADGWLWYKWALLNLKAAYVGTGGTKFVRFGDRIVLMPAKKLVQAKYTVKGKADNPAALPTSAEKGTAYVINTNPNDPQNPKWSLFVWTGDEWDSMGAWIINMEAELTATKITISDGTIYGAAATANTLTINSPASANLAKAGFQIGDAVEIDGLTTEPDNNKIAIIREIGSRSLIFRIIALRSRRATAERSRPRTARRERSRCGAACRTWTCALSSKTACGARTRRRSLPARSAIRRISTFLTA